MAQSLHSHGTVTAQSLHSHCTVTAQSRHSHGTATTQSLHNACTCTSLCSDCATTVQQPHTHRSATCLLRSIGGAFHGLSVQSRRSRPCRRGRRCHSRLVLLPVYMHCTYMKKGHMYGSVSRHVSGHECGRVSRHVYRHVCRLIFGDLTAPKAMGTVVGQTVEGRAWFDGDCGRSNRGGPGMVRWRLW